MISFKGIDHRYFFSDEWEGDRFKYGFKFRQTGFQPEGWLIGSQLPHPDLAHGTLDWPRQLSEKEIHAFELTELFKP